ncbi:amidase [Sinorhizobium terangae]|uniref:amidase n=1 Tax=Sinorhizobium terangae TaxID=110322 RepID=UPI0024B11DDB|nr:amidase [Sinorhizobium terangae]WFU51672.1 amidase [Sinorhizobium terangae]
MSGLSEDIRFLYRDSDALALSDLIKSREIKPSELMEAAIAAAEELNPVLNAVVSTDYTVARKLAAQSDCTGIFAGVPYLAKDVSTSVAGFRITNGSRFYDRYTQPCTDDAEEVRRLRREGLIPFGITNAPEVGSALTTEPKLHGPTCNPWNQAFSVGGSSGGAAAAVAARIVPIAGASDGGGSIRMPAGACGTVGLKPSRGRIPVYPAADRFYGMEVSGCISRTVRDTAAYLDAISGSLVGEPYTPPIPGGSFLQLSSRDPGRLRIGVTTSLPFGHKLDGEVFTSIADTARLLESMGHDLEPYDLTFDLQACRQAYIRVAAVLLARQFMMAEAEFGATLTADDVEPVIRARIEEGTTVDAITHAMDIDTLRHSAREIAASLASFDAFLCPVFPRPIFRIGEYGSIFNSETASTLTTFLFPINVSGLPAISLPMHQSLDGLPLGVQLVGRYGDEATLLQLAHSLEKEVRWDKRQPPIIGVEAHPKSPK